MFNCLGFAVYKESIMAFRQGTGSYAYCGAATQAGTERVFGADFGVLY